jgi:CheY-like chemotaxis protein
VIDAPPRILVAEKDHQVRGYLTRVLTTAGYAVTEATDGPAALDALSHPLAGFDAAILHDHLAGIAAPAVLRAARGWGVDTPALIISGAASDAAHATAAADDRVALLAKPVRPADLVLAVVALTGYRPIN